MTATDVRVLLLAIALVLVAGLLVGAETAIGRVSRTRVEELRRDGVRGAARLAAVVDDRPRYVNVLLFLSTVATVTATALVTVVAVEWLTRSGWSIGWAVTAAVAVMVLVSYVVLGVAPRTLGRQHADRIALRSAGIARLLATLLGPVTGLLILVGNALTPGRGYREGPFASQAELRELVDQAGADSVIEDDERQMIHSVFELGDTIAREVMVPRTEMITIERHRSLRQAMSLSMRSGFSRIPVVGEGADDVVGVVYLKDVVRRVLEDDADDAERVDLLMRPVYFVPDSKQVDELLRDMQAARVHLAIVVDEYGGTAGLVTIEDVLEEIVGEIADEYDTEQPEVVLLPDGSVRLSSRMHVEDFGDLIGMEVDAEEEGVDTVLGLVAKRLGRVPIAGATVVVGGWRLTAEQAEGRRNRIGTLLAEPPTPAAEPGDDDEPDDDGPGDESGDVAPAAHAEATGTGGTRPEAASA